MRQFKVYGILSLHRYPTRRRKTAENTSRKQSDNGRKEATTEEEGEEKNHTAKACCRGQWQWDLPPHWGWGTTSPPHAAGTGSLPTLTAGTATDPLYVRQFHLPLTSWLLYRASASRPRSLPLSAAADFFSLSLSRRSVFLSLLSLAELPQHLHYWRRIQNYQ